MVQTDNQNVFFPESTDIVCIRNMDLAALKKAALESDVKRARYCLHAFHDDGVQEMIIVLCRNTDIPIHRHINKTESFHIIEGELEVQLFDDLGQQINSIKMGTMDSGLTFIYRINTAAWHTVKLTSQIAVIHEVVEGPFDGKMEILNYGR